MKEDNTILYLVGGGFLFWWFFMRNKTTVTTPIIQQTTTIPTGSYLSSEQSSGQLQIVPTPSTVSDLPATNTASSGDCSSFCNCSSCSSSVGYIATKRIHAI